MRIAVFGASGGTGTEVVRQALEKDMKSLPLFASPEK